MTNGNRQLTKMAQAIKVSGQANFLVPGGHA
jgi:hypothetical protein